MYLFYVYGSGLGHLNRVLNFIYTQKIALEEVVIITNSSFCSFIPKTINVISKEDSFFKDKISLYNFITDCIKKHQISTLIIDVFPAGFYGEFEKGFNQFNVTTVLLARILKEAYFKTYSCPEYNLIYFLEDGITKEKYKYLKTAVLDLKQRPNLTNENSFQLKEPFYVIMHSSPEDEVLLLYKQALLYRTTEYIYIYTYNAISPSLLSEKTMVIQKEKVSKKILEKADKIFTGYGFNTALETKEYLHKQHIIPFKRKFDDQFKRKRIVDKKT